MATATNTTSAVAAAAAPAKTEYKSWKNEIRIQTWSLSKNKQLIRVCVRNVEIKAYLSLNVSLGFVWGIKSKSLYMV